MPRHEMKAFILAEFVNRGSGRRGLKKGRLAHKEKSTEKREVKTLSSHLPGWMGVLDKSLSGDAARPARRGCLTRVILAATR